MKQINEDFLDNIGAVELDKSSLYKDEETAHSYPYFATDMSAILDDDDDYDDYDDDDYDDFDDDDDVEDVKVYNRKPDRRRLAPAQPMQRQPMRQDMGQPMQRRKAPSQDIDLDDDFSFDFIKK